MIPAITTGITDFIINSGFKTADAEIPMLALAVPYDAPKASKVQLNSQVTNFKNRFK